MPKKINLNVNMNWFQTSEISEYGQNKTKTFAGSAQVGGNSAENSASIYEKGFYARKNSQHLY